MRKFSSNPISVFPPKGFSLLELLVAIALLSTLLILLYNAFFQISDSTQKVTESLKAEQELRLLMKIVLDDLQAVEYLGHWAAERDEDIVYHSGILSKRIPGPDETPVSFVQFHTASPTRFFPEAIALQKDPELHEVEYFLKFDPFAQTWLFIRREDFYVDDDISEGGLEQTLSESVVDFQMEFLEQTILEADSGEIQEVWLEEWDSLESDCVEEDKDISTPENPAPPCLPLAIRLTLSLQKEADLVTETLELNLPELLKERLSKD